MAITILDEKDKRDLEQEIGKKLDRSGWTPDKYLGVDNEGNVTEKDIPKESADKSLGITGADIGQTIVVKSVDENGKPTEWETVDMPSGGSGGGETWRLLNSIVVEEDVGVLSVTADSDGRPLSLKKVKVFARIRGNTSGAANWIRLDVNGLRNTFNIPISNGFAATDGQDNYWQNRVDISIHDRSAWCDLILRSNNNAASKNSLQFIQLMGQTGGLDIGIEKIERLDIYASGAGVGAGSEIVIWGVDAE